MDVSCSRRWLEHNVRARACHLVPERYVCSPHTESATGLWQEKSHFKITAHRSCISGIYLSFLYQKKIAKTVASCWCFQINGLQLSANSCSDKLYIFEKKKKKSCTSCWHYEINLYVWSELSMSHYSEKERLLLLLNAIQAHVFITIQITVNWSEVWSQYT